MGLRLVLGASSLGMESRKVSMREMVREPAPVELAPEVRGERLRVGELCSGMKLEVRDYLKL